MPLTIRDTLLWYKRTEVRAAMLLGARNKEIGVRYGDGFGKRPDALEYEQEILEAVQRGATSFHASEELWLNPRAIETGMNKERTHELRTGWDLVFDVDFTNFEATKRITHALCQSLERHGVTAYGVKFSGNKGFHIGVAWESWPQEFGGKPVAQMFPDAARQIATYIVHDIDNPDNGFALSEALFTVVADADSHLVLVCATCGRDRATKEESKHFVCFCGFREVKPASFTDPYIVCPECKRIVQPLVHESELVDECICGSQKSRKKFDLKIDTQLISSRHLYRLEYSLHEKSGLVSLPIAAASILQFSRELAQPNAINVFPEFWHRHAHEQAADLFETAMEFRAAEHATVEAKEVIWDDAAAPESSFPPTIQKMLLGLEDGKKRSLFILTNFLRSVGWSHDMIEERLQKWNLQNSPPLRDAEISNHLRYHKQRGQTVLPPNFDNDIYKDLGVLVHDELSVRVKNPVQYVRLKLKQRGGTKKAPTAAKEPAENSESQGKK